MKGRLETSMFGWSLVLLLAACGSQAPSGNSFTMTGPADHAKHFPIASTDVHGPNVLGVPAGSVNCNACHATLSGTPPVSTPADSFSTYACIGCHVQVAGGAAWHDDSVTMAALHVNVPNFVFASANCYACHPDGTGAPANHGALFPIGSASAHKTVHCADCHLDRTLPHDTTKYACDTCHLNKDPALAGKHGTVGGVAILTVHTGRTTTGPPLTMTSPDCLRCHADSQVNRVASHTTGDSGFSRPEHNGAGCVTCHSANRTDKPYPATNWKAAGGCVTCHPNGTGG